MMRFILLRGLGREQQHWGELYAMLSKHFPDAKIDTPDLAGSGILNGISSPLKIADYIPYLTKQIDTLQTVNDTKNMTILIGLSLGGMIALHWYAQKSEKFSHLVLINASSQLNPFYDRIKLSNVMPQLGSLVSNNTKASEVARYKLTCNKMPINATVINEWVNIQQQHPIKWTNLLKQLCAASLFTPPKRDQIKDNKNMIIFSSTYDQLVNVCCSEKLSQYYKIPIVYHPWAGHDIPQDDPKWLCQQLTLFMV